MSDRPPTPHPGAPDPYGAPHAPSYPTGTLAPPHLAPPHPAHAPNGASATAPSGEGSRLASAALALACLPLGVTNVLGVVLGAVGMAAGPRVRPRWGMSVAAVVVGTLWMAAGAGIGVAVWAGDRDDADTAARIAELSDEVEDLRGDVFAAMGPGGAYSETEMLAELDDEDERAAVDVIAEDVPVADLAPGTCVLDPALNQVLWIGEHLPTVGATVDCADAHDAELVGTITVPDRIAEDGWDSDPFLDFAWDSCDDAFYDYAGDSGYWEAEDVYTAFVPPSEEAWEAGDRVVHCFASGEVLTTGSLRAVEAG
ncbi:MAG: septum formation family protein [Nocardioides alkalitolerans]